MFKLNSHYVNNPLKYNDPLVQKVRANTDLVIKKAGELFCTHCPKLAEAMILLEKIFEK
jgi:hypothetical protein